MPCYGHHQVHYCIRMWLLWTSRNLCCTLFLPIWCTLVSAQTWYAVEVLSGNAMGVMSPYRHGVQAAARWHVSLLSFSCGVNVVSLTLESIGLHGLSTTSAGRGLSPYGILRLTMRAVVDIVLIFSSTSRYLAGEGWGDTDNGWGDADEGWDASEPAPVVSKVVPKRPAKAKAKLKLGISRKNDGKAD